MFFLLKQIAIISVSSLFSNKMRSFLTMLGIIIGVGAVIIIMSVGAGAQNLILSQVESLGSNLVGVMPGKADDSGPPTSVMGIVITTLVYDDLKALADKNNVPNIIDIVGYTNSVGVVSFESNKYDTKLSGTTVGYLNVEGGEVDEGRFFTKEEETNLSRVIVLGSVVKDELFGDSDPIGKRVKIKKHTFEVIGVMRERGTVAFQDYDDQVFLPLKTMQKLIAGVNHLSLIRAEVDDEENIEKTMEDMKITLREQHDIDDASGGNDDFTVRSAAQALDILETITDALRYFLALMAALSLLVGGIGIMNIMLVSVTERTREIGLRKAIGAKNSNILTQFLAESIVITLVGGIVGIIVGIGISFLISIVVNYLGYNWNFIITLSSVFLAFSISMIVGLIFGIYPASKASGLEPVEALRYE